LTSRSKGKGFSMGCRVFVSLSAILGGCYQVTVIVNDNGTHRYFTGFTCRLAECDRLTHPLPMNQISSIINWW
jgi:hypothetical protein